MTKDVEYSKESKPRRGVWLKLLLFVSLAFNLLIVGGAIGMLAFSSGRGPDGPPRVRDHTLFPLVAMLPREDRAELGHAMGPPDKERGDWRRDRSELIERLRSEPFDAQGFALQLSARREARNADAARLEDSLSRHIASMTSGERAAYADRIDRLDWPRKSGR